MIDKFSIPCIILSGGKSQRMGEDKSLLPFGSSSSLIEFQYNRLKLYFQNIYISSKSDKFSFLQDKKELIIDENLDIYSPILALQTIIKTLENEKVFIITVDTPFITLEIIEKLINSSDNFDITIAQTSFGTHNLCGVFSKTTLTLIEDMIKSDIHKINYLIKNSRTQNLYFENEEEFLNLNDKAEYKKALKIIN